MPTLLILLVLMPGMAWAEPLCGKTPEVSANGSSMMPEQNFSVDKALGAFQYFEVALPQLIRSSNLTQEVVRNELFYVGYPNHLRVVEGAFLRSQALLRKSEHALILEQRKAGKATSEEVGAAEQRLKDAKEQFCKFVGQARYSD